MHVKLRAAFIRQKMREADAAFNLALALQLGAGIRRAALRTQLEAQRAARAVPT